jgi:hypothetical protein
LIKSQKNLLNQGVEKLAVRSIKLLIPFGKRSNGLRSGTVDLVPIYKKGVKTECGNYTGISLLPITYKIFSYLLLSRLTP